ncbi:hypothetical protein ACYSNR_14245 [Enterococcus sp. LJL128]|uniref:hypothetical protein n=1 Tax=Enterococcus sp. LJL51 TaxID=3416656 RepID=UPI003CE6FDBC
MNKKYFLIVVLLLQLVGCEQGNTKTASSVEIATTSSFQTFTTRSSSSSQLDETLPEEHSLRNGETYDKLLSLPESQTKKTVTDIRKIIYKESGLYDIYTTQEFFADLKNKNMNLYPFRNTGDIEPDWNLTEKDVTKIHNIIEDNNVLDWKKSYGTEPDPERTSNSEAFWTLLLVFNDDTNQIHKKYYGDDSPMEYENFIKELLAFREEKREEWRKSTESD